MARDNTPVHNPPQVTVSMTVVSVTEPIKALLITDMQQGGQEVDGTEAAHPIPIHQQDTSIIQEEEVDS